MKISCARWTSERHLICLRAHPTKCIVFVVCQKAQSNKVWLGVKPFPGGGGSGACEATPPMANESLFSTPEMGWVYFISRATLLPPPLPKASSSLSSHAVLGRTPSLFLPFAFPSSLSPFALSSSHRRGPDTNHISPGRCGSGRYINTVKGGRVSVLKPYDKHSSLPCCLLPGLWHRDGSVRQQSSLLSPTPINTTGQNPQAAASRQRKQQPNGMFDRLFNIGLIAQLVRAYG